MKIEVFGTGCANCQKTKKIIQEVLEERNQSAEVIEVTDINDIIARGIIMTPAVAIDGEVKISGRVPKYQEIEELLGG